RRAAGLLAARRVLRFQAMDGAPRRGALCRQPPRRKLSLPQPLCRSRHAVPARVVFVALTAAHALLRAALPAAVLAASVRAAPPPADVELYRHWCSRCHGENGD